MEDFNIIERISEFIETFMVKYKYENRGILRKFRIDSRLNMDLDNEKWCSYFLNKSCLNYCAKILLLRYFEDNGFIVSKMNVKGIESWRNLVKNISEKFHVLYSIAILDLQGEKNHEISFIFQNSDYDVYPIDDELAAIIIKNFSSIDFSNIKKNQVITWFRQIYSLEQREEWGLEGFYKNAPALSYIIQLDKAEMDNG
ncbi:MAG: hypothetical protein ACOYVK_04860 [Bacillota bacterium]